MSESVKRPSIRIIPLAPQLRSEPPGAGDTMVGVPPEIGTRWILPSATNAISLLSGDQYARCSFSVPGTTRGVVSSIRTTQARETPTESEAWNSNVRPSGETRGQLASRRAGRSIGGWKRYSGARVWSRGHAHTPNAVAATTATAATAHASMAFPPRARAATAGADGVEGGVTTALAEDTDSPAFSAMCCSRSFTSCAVWMRSCGSLLRQSRIRASSPAGGPPAATAPEPDGTSPIDGGWRSRIAAMSEAWLRPSNARRAVAIS